MHFISKRLLQIIGCLCVTLCCAVLPGTSMGDEGEKKNANAEITDSVVVNAYSFREDYDSIERKTKSVFLVGNFDKNEELMSFGSGFVCFDEHLFVTNQHVIDQATSLAVLDDDDNMYILDQVVLSDKEKDVAILLFPDGKKYESLNINEDGELKRGQPVVTIGSPEGYQNTVAFGNISAFLKQDNMTMIQFTAPISHGSSGGCLFDDSGNVIGVTSAGVDEGQNIGFAIPIKIVKELYDQWDKKSFVQLGTKRSWDTVGTISIPSFSVKPILSPTPSPAPTLSPSPKPTSTASNKPNDTTGALPTRDSLKFNMELSSTAFAELETVTVSITVANVGESDLPGSVTLYYPSGKQVEEFDSSTLTAGSSKSWKGAWSITQKELDEGKITFVVRYYAYNEEGELQSYAAGLTKHITYSGTESNPDEKHNADSSQQDMLQIEASVDRDVVYTMPAQVCFTVTVTNNSNVDVSNIGVYAVNTKLYTFASIPAGESKTFTRDVLISGAGTFQFEAWTKDEFGQPMNFQSNTIPIKYMTPAEDQHK